MLKFSVTALRTPVQGCAFQQETMVCVAADVLQAGDRVRQAAASARNEDVTLWWVIAVVAVDPPEGQIVRKRR
jgi:hypothetical protein